MDALLDAIDTAIAADADLLAALSGGYYRVEAPAGTSFPYMTIHIIGNQPFDTFRTYGETMQIQFNVVSNEKLREAQKNPEEHKDLLIRVAGYSAFFVELDSKIQEDIIDRVEHGL